MKRTLRALPTITAFAALLIAAATSPNAAWAACSTATLNGNYGFTFSGFANNRGSGSTVFPFQGEGVVSFDGAGSFSGSFNSSFNGDSFTGNTISGKYTVNADCTGLLNGNPGTNNFAFVIVSGGAEILAVNLTAGQTFTVDLKKQ